MVEKDPYMLDPQEQEVIHRKKTKLQSSGLPCPKRHSQLGGVCHVCDRVSALFSTDIQSDRDIAVEKMAKGKYYFNAVLPQEPTQLVLLETGKKAGDDIIHGIKNAGWVDIAHPKAGKGRELVITRRGQGRENTVYNVSPNLEKADWDVPNAVLENLYNLDNILDLVNDPEINLVKVTVLKPDEKITFRICPPWDNGKNNREIYTIVWRHWGVTQSEIDGTQPMDIRPLDRESNGVESTTPGLDYGLAEKENSVTAPTPEPTTGTAPQKDEPCLGNTDLYSQDDEECRNCHQFKQCGRIVMKKTADSDMIPF